MDNSLSFAKSVLWNSVGSLVYLGSSWLTTVLVVVLTNDYAASGQLAVAMAVGNIFSTIMLFRTRTVQVSDVSGCFSASDYVGFRTVCFMLASAFCFVYSLVTVASNDALVVIAYIIFKSGESFVDVLQGELQKKNRFDIIGISQMMRGIALIVAFVLGIELTGSLFISVLLMAVTTIAIICVYDIPKTRQYVSVTPAYKFSKLKSLAASCLPGFAAMLACTMTISLTRQVYGNEFGSEQLGIYAAVAAPTVIAQALASYVYAPMLVPISKMWSGGDNASIIRLTIRFVLILILIVFVLIALASTIGAPVFRLVYGDDITGYLYLINPLLICTGITAAVYFFQDLLIIIRSYSTVVAAGVSSLVVAIVGMDASFSAFGMNGITIIVIIAYFASILVSLLGMTVSFRSRI